MAGILPVVAILFLQVFLSYLCMKSRRIRRLVCGESVILAKDGKINVDYMNKMLITVDDLSEMLRTSGLKDINDLDTLIIETNGKANVTEKKDKGIITTVIENGRIIPRAFSGDGINMHDMNKALEDGGFSGCDKVFWGFYFDGKYYFLRKETK